MSSSNAALAGVEEVLRKGGDADDILRGVVAALHEAGYAWAGLFFVEEGALALGPEAGVAAEEHRTRIPVRWQSDVVAELAVDCAAPGDTATLEQFGDLVSGHCLVGWDTGGEPWVSSTTCPSNTRPVTVTGRVRPSHAPHEVHDLPRRATSHDSHETWPREA
jgi:hypothetical protein